jgi:hypothetical protein
MGNAPRASWDLAMQVLTLFREAGWTGEEIHRRFVTHWGILRDIAMALDTGLVTEERIRALIDGKSAVSAFQALPAACQQELVHPYSNEQNFPLEPISPDEDDWEVCKYHFPGIVNGEEAFSELEKLGYRLLGGLRRATQFVVDHPDLLLKHELIVTASWQGSNGYRYAPLFSLGSHGCNIQLYGLQGFYNSTYGWLVLKKRVA